GVRVMWRGMGIGALCYAAIPRGVLQGTQRFTALSANLGLELVGRVVGLVAFLALGLAVTGSVMAMLAGVTFAYLIGMWSVRDLLGVQREEVRMRAMLSFGPTAAPRTLGILLPYNLDFVLPQHYLDNYNAGLYGTPNKIHES